MLARTFLHSAGLHFSFLLCLSALTLPVQAETKPLTCNEEYTVVSGDSLSDIAQRAYGDSLKFTLIYYANQATLPNGAAVIRLGQKLRIPCTDEAKTLIKAAETEPATKQDTPTTTKKTETAKSTEEPAIPSNTRQALVKFLTAGDYAPFTDPSLPNNGLVTELVEAALKNQQVNYRVDWVNDWSAHLNPLLKEHSYDMGFPWLNPGCPNVDHPRCDFLFSKPVFDMLVVLFTRADKPLKFDKDDDMIGRTLCRPAGYYTHDLERPGREWLKKSLITFEQPKEVADCFDLLMKGKVDAVAVNDFTGREAVARLGLNDKVVVLPHELSVEGLHVVIHKTHPRATILMHRVNNGLDALHDSGEYDEILDRHLMNHWKTVKNLQQ